MALNVPKVKLSDGKEMPQFGLGTWVRFFYKHKIKNSPQIFFFFEPENSLID